MNTAGALLLPVLTATCFYCYATGFAVAAVARLAALLVSAAAVLLLLVLLARFCHQQLRMYWMTRHLPGLWPTLPLLGNILEVSAVSQEDIIDTLMQYRKRLGATFRIWIGLSLTMFCSEPEDLQVMLGHRDLQMKGSMYEALSSFLGNGLVTRNSSHYRQRKALTPSFHQTIIKSFIPAFAIEGCNLKKAMQELDEVFADLPSRPVTAADLPRLRYLEMTIKEVMRYFPLVPLYARTATADVTLPSGTVVPRGCQVAIFPKFVHWDPRWYPDPSVFDPDRHKPEVADKKPNFTYIPFSAGARGCIGQRYAMVLSKTMAATVLREYRFLPAPDGVKRLCDLKLVVGVAVHVHGGVNVRVERRQRLS